MIDRFALRPRPQRAIADGLFRAWQWASRLGTLGHDTTVGRRFQAMGEHAALAFPPGPLTGVEWIRIGASTLLGPHVALAATMWPGERVDPERGWVIRIGDGCNIGRGSSIVGRHGIDIGDDVTTGPWIYITDHNHRYDDRTLPIAKQWVDEAPVSIGPGCWLGAGAVVLPGTTLGRNVVVAAGSVVRGDVADFSVVAGVPGKVVRRWTGDEWDPPLGRHQHASEPPEGWFDT